jgi:uncharacterized protein
MKMRDENKKILLRVAKDSLNAAVNGQSIAHPHSDDPELSAKCGCFVTLKTNGQLRGCLGQFTSDQPLIRLVSEMAQSSATSDPRFASNRIKPTELDSLEIEISALSVLEKTDDPLCLELGKHGIYIKNGFASGCFLPQVAEETGWSKEEFLGYCCSHKAGLTFDAWKDPQTEVYLFTAEIFHANYNEIE